MSFSDRPRQHYKGSAPSHLSAFESVGSYIKPVLLRPVEAAPVHDLISLACLVILRVCIQNSSEKGADPQIQSLCQANVLPSTVQNVSGLH